MITPDFNDGRTVVLLLGLILYGMFLLVTLVAAVRHSCRASSRCRVSISGLFYVLVLVFVCCRVVWTCISLWVWCEPPPTPPVPPGSTNCSSGGGSPHLSWGFNVGSDCLFFSCFSLIAVHWAETNSRTTVGESRMFSSVMVWVFLATNVVLYLFQAGVLAFVVTHPTSDSAKSLVLTSILVAILENVLVGIGFLIFGLRLYCVLQSARSTIADDATLGQKRSIQTTLLVTLVMTACFLGRSVLYVVQVTMAVDSDGLMDVRSIPRLVLIYVSELLPVTYQLWQLRARRRRDDTHTRFIADLYEQNEVASSDQLPETDSLLLNGDPSVSKTIN